MFVKLKQQTLTMAHPNSFSPLTTRDADRRLRSCVFVFFVGGEKSGDSSEKTKRLLPQRSICRELWKGIVQRNEKHTI